MSEHMFSAAKKPEPVSKPPRPMEVLNEDDSVAIDPETGLELINDEDIIKEEPVDLDDADLIDEEPDSSHFVSGTYEKGRIEAGMLQTEEVVEAERVLMSDGVDVAIALAKKEGRQENGERNEDNVLVYESPDLGLMTGVMDGLGGVQERRNAAADASAVVESHLPNYAESFLRELSDSEVSDVLKGIRFTKIGEQGPEATSDADRDSILGSADPIIQKKIASIVKALEKVNDDVTETGGKTTACITTIHTMDDGRRFAITANIGDSGAFKRSADGNLQEITREDSLLNELLAEGYITTEKIQEMRSDPKVTFKLGKEMSYQALKMTNTRGLGSSTADPSISLVELKPGDSIVLATDGSIDFFEDQDRQETDMDVLRATLHGDKAEEQADNLFEVTRNRQKLADKEGSYKKNDDIALVVVKAEKEPRLIADHIEKAA